MNFEDRAAVERLARDEGDEIDPAQFRADVRGMARALLSLRSCVEYLDREDEEE